MKYFQTNSARHLVLAAVMMVGSFGAAQAETNPPAAADPASQLSPAQRAHLQEFQQKRTELLELRQQLEQIRQETVTKHPELKEREKAFGNQVAEQMKSNGATPSEDFAELQSLQEKLRDEKTPEADRQALMMRLQRKAQEFHQARQQALQNPELQKAQGELLQDIVSAMKEEDPRAEQIMQQMQQKQQEMMKIREAAQAAEGQ